jgi:Tfp pilus assembly protein PilN
MRAVNLIPAEQQRGAGGAAGRSSGGAYFLVGGLALLVLMAALYVQSGKSITDKKAEVVRVSQEATAAEAKAASLQSYTKFSALRTKRVDTVTQLAASRFDWAHSLREVARVLPTNAWLTSLTGTTSSAVSVGAGGGSSLRSALDVPAIEISGCTTSQASVAKMMASLRLIDGVQRVSLEDSTKNTPSADDGGATSPSGSASSGDDCRGRSSHFPLFKLVVFYDAPTTSVPVTGGTAATASAVTPAPSSATPASSTTPAASGGVTP